MLGWATCRRTIKVNPPRPVVSVTARGNPRVSNTTRSSPVAPSPRAAATTTATNSSSDSVAQIANSRRAKRRMRGILIERCSSPAGDSGLRFRSLSALGTPLPAAAEVIPTAAAQAQPGSPGELCAPEQEHCPC